MLISITNSEMKLVGKTPSPHSALDESATYQDLGSSGQPGQREAPHSAESWYVSAGRTVTDVIILVELKLWTLPHVVRTAA
jgi:hypothetical protein